MSSVTLIAGLSFFYAADVMINTREHGKLNLKRHRLIELRALYTPADSLRTSLAKQLGGEVQVTYGGMFGIAVLVGAGWDGDMAMLTLGIGAGAPRSFTGKAPDAASVMRGNRATARLRAPLPIDAVHAASSLGRRVARAL